MNLSKRATSILAGAVVAVGIAGPAVAAITTTSAGGGTWTYGTARGKVVSNFHHYDRYHQSSVQPAGGAVYTSNCAKPMRWSKASAKDTFWFDKAYFNFCD